MNFLREKIEIETNIIQSNQGKNLKIMVESFKLENFLSATSPISKIGHLVSILICIKRGYKFSTYPVYRWKVNLTMSRIHFKYWKKYFNFVVL